MKMILKILIVVIILYLISTISLYLLQEKLIFLNKRLDANYKYTFTENFEELYLKTEDNQSINALLFKANNPKGVILYFHGNKGNLTRWGKIASEFTKYNHDILVMDYRSYGKSTGKFNENMMYKDAVLCYDYLKERYGEDKISVYGRSLGTTFATKVASIRNPQQLILEAPFCNLQNVIDYHYPLLTQDFLLKYKFRTDSLIGMVKCPTTIFHGTEDRVIPIASSKKLFEKLQKNNTNYIEIEKGTHHNLKEFKEYINTISMLFN